MSDMTRSEAIKRLKWFGEYNEEDYCGGDRIKTDGKWYYYVNKDDLKAFEMAISSLETDEAYQLEYESTTKSETLISLEVYKQVARERDIAIQQLNELGYEFGQKIEPTTKNDLGVDCISRKVMRDLGATCIAYRNDEQELIPIISIDELPSVTPQEPINSVLEDIKTEIKRKANSGQWSDATVYGM